MVSSLASGQISLMLSILSLTAVCFALLGVPRPWPPAVMFLTTARVGAVSELQPKEKLDGLLSCSSAC